MKTIPKQIKLKLIPLSTQKIITVSNLTQDELDFRDGLLNYLQHYHAPRGYEVIDFTILD